MAVWSLQLSTLIHLFYLNVPLTMYIPWVHPIPHLALKTILILRRYTLIFI